MKLYNWTSAYLSSYLDGNIVVCANSVEEARDLARKAIQKHLNVHGPRWSGATREEAVREFEADIAKEPDCKPDTEDYNWHLYDGVILIDGDDG